MANDVEIELKLPLKNREAVIDFLHNKAKFKYEKQQHDTYFNAPHRDFLQDPDNVDEWLRIRIAGETAQINYKDWQPHDKREKTHCTEYETEVASSDQLLKIFTALNFVKITDVKKLRRSWDYKEAEISIDSVEELGDYIEVEYKGSLKDVEEVRRHLFAVLAELGAETGKIDYRGYPYLLLEKKGLIGAKK